MYKENYNKIHKREIDYIARFHVYGFVHNKENSQQKRGKKNAVRRNSEAADKRSGNGGNQPGYIKISSRAATEVMQIPTICLGFSFCFFILSVT